MRGLYGCRLAAAIVDQPQAAEAAQKTEARSIELMQDSGIRVVDGFVKEAVELFVELLAAIEARLGRREQFRLG